ncbi:hydantoinase B/oxoprolinase family protein (plasmid) [Roseomonas sp. OT10]|uniref:hydantoinase B/oxoprolinase family protein n=1 Tax=Roseomonas cutis TaxID=2897332 RepID=UPI001E5D1B5B|nr:hydantoinase B/oxoprolinase family protein [Roseomonas sp. OT10]UFN51549.1 hydantoinase B/oxoprolinase family protein [Roseomonas sp. OT10]
MNASSRRTDPIMLEVLMGRFRSIAEEMGYALQRTGHTVFVNETADLGVALVTPGGEIFGYPRSIGITMFAGLDFRDVLRRAGPLEEGDILACNDPYSTGGLSSHLPDISLIMPVFAGGELLCYAYAYVHSTDVGGKVPGSLSPSSYEVFQEGIRIPPTRIYRGGVEQSEVLELILANCRVPKDNIGDIRAMVTALRIGEARMREAAVRNGRDVLAGAMADALDYSEARARGVIAGIPDGTYRFHDYLDDDATSPIPIRFEVAVTVAGDRLHLDFTGSDPQVRAAFNIPSAGKPHPWLIYKVMFLLLTLQPDVPVNAGLLRPVTVLAPEGSIVNCLQPAAVGLRTTAGVRLQDAVCGALAQALPNAVPAAGAGYIAPVVMAEPDFATGGTKVNVVEPMVGGTGASPAGDGLNARDVVDIANLRNSPLEIVEGAASLLVRRYGLRPDSGGPGRHRGGLGAVLEFEVLAPTAILTARGQERHRFQPWGMVGGRPAAGAGAQIRRAGEASFSELPKIDSLQVSAGDVLRILTPGGGGHGSPLSRPAAEVLEDVRDGFVSAAAAADDYGVVIRDGAVDAEATRALRAERQEAAAGPAFAFGTEREAYECRWTEAVWERFSTLLYDLPVPLRSEARRRLWTTLEERAARHGALTPQDVTEAWAALNATRPGMPQRVAEPQSALA